MAHPAASALWFGVLCVSPGISQEEFDKKYSAKTGTALAKVMGVSPTDVTFGQNASKPVAEPKPAAAAKPAPTKPEVKPATANATTTTEKGLGKTVVEPEEPQPAVKPEAPVKPAVAEPEPAPEPEIDPRAADLAAKAAAKAAEEAAAAQGTAAKFTTGEGMCAATHAVVCGSQAY